MDPMCSNEPPPRQKIPKDGMGPRGLPDCYYTSRVLNSTFRYVRFINKLRAREAEERFGNEILARDTKDKQRREFFALSDRKNLINNVRYRVNLCMQAYEDDLQRKRQRLKDLLTVEEEENTRKFAAQAQTGPEIIWQAKKDRLAFLLNKRKQEHEAKHTYPPLDRASHLLPCLINIRTRESKEYQLYQMREKQMRRESEREMEKMWHEVVMKEAEALDARMEYEEIERARRQKECNDDNDRQLQLHRMQRAKDREMLKQEVMQRNREMEEEDRKLAEEEREQQGKRANTNLDKQEMMKEREEAVAQQQANSKLVSDTWNQLTAAVIAKNEEKAAEELRIRKRSDLDECNLKMAELKQDIEKVKNNNEQLIAAEGWRRQDELDLERCRRTKWSQRVKAEDAAANYKVFLEKQASSNGEHDGRDYDSQVQAQLEQLIKHKELTEAQARKLYQNDLREQIAYNKLLKERARQEELDQIKKCEVATKQYYKEMEEMLCRPYFSTGVHPFLKQMDSGLQIKKCPCSLPNYCQDPKMDAPAHQK